MTAHSLRRFLRYLSRFTGGLGGVIIVATGWSFEGLGDAFSPKPFFILYGVMLIKYGIALHRRITPTLVHQYFSALMVPGAIIPLFIFLGPSGSTTGTKAFIAIVYFFVVAAIYKYLLAKSGTILFGQEIIE